MIEAHSPHNIRTAIAADRHLTGKAVCGMPLF
jgi:hypothetical protein